MLLLCCTSFLFVQNLSAQQQHPECGEAVVTCFSGFNTPTNYLSGVNQNAPVMALVDVRDHSTGTLGTWWQVASASEYSDPSWTPQNLGQVFGIAIDGNNDIFVAASTIYTCATTSPYAYNPFTTLGGPGAVYKINGITGAVTNYVTTGAFVPGGTRIPNNGSALGNICYDPLHNQFFVTNHADGMVYRIKNGLVMSRFDPFGTVNPPASGFGTDPSFVALGERTWGVGYYNGRVYFARWTEDIQRQNPSASNEIWSIGLDGVGEFQGTFYNGGGQKWEDGEVLEITMPCYPVNAAWSNPVSDIAFSKAGLMLLAERTMSSDCGGAFSTSWFGYAHSARVLEYEFNGSAWVLTPGHVASVCSSNTNKKFTTGAANGTTDNSAGGVDYGYGSFDPSTPPPYDCDRFIWNTGDNLHPPTGFNSFCSQNGTTWVYGMQGTPASGGTNLNSLLIDFDNNVCSHDKILIGDVEIFKCGCKEPPSDFPCDSLWVTKKPQVFDPGTQPDTCCWSMNFHVHTGPLAYMEVASLTPGVIFNNPSLSSSFLWNGAPTGTLLPIRRNPIGPIPNGDYNDALKFCLGNILTPAQDTQCVEIRWFIKGPDDIPYLACKDTCYFYCPPPVYGDTCLVVKNDSVTCNPDKPLEYCYFFQVQNLANFNANQVVLSNPTPGFGFKPCPPPNIPFTSPSIALNFSPDVQPDSCTPQLCVKIVATSPILSPTQFCFEAGLSSNDSCCHSPKKHCILLEPCCNPCEKKGVTLKTTNPDSCCHSLDIKNDCNLQFFTKLELQLLTPGVIFGSHYTGGPMPGNWFNPISTNTLIQWQHISGFVPNGTTAGLINFCLDGIDMPSEVPQTVVLNWIAVSSTGEDSIACSDTLIFDCPPTDFGCIKVVENSIHCEMDANGNTYYQYNLTFKNASSPPHFATELIITQIGGPPVLVFPNPVNFFPPGANYCDTTSITTNIYPTGTVNPGDKLVFLVRLHDALNPDNWCCFEGDTLCIFVPPCGDCVCNQPEMVITQNGIDYPLFCTQGASTPVLPCPAADVTISGFFGCISATGEPCPETTVAWSLTGPNGFIGSGLTTPFPSLTFTAGQVGAPGTYFLTLSTLCPGAVDSCICTVRWIQEACDSCCLDYDAFCQNVQNAVTVMVDNALCKVKVTIGNLPDCDYLEYVNWGDGQQNNGPFTGGSMGMHTYAGSGTYIISWLAIETNAAGLICFEKLFKDTITVQCPPVCQCGDWNLKFEQPGVSFPVTCNNQPPLMLGCPVAPIHISGTFNCLGPVPGCEPSPVHWTLHSPTGTLSGNTVAGAININFPAATVSAPGNYQLVLQSLCPGMPDSCVCVINWVQPPCVDCACGSFTKIKIKNKKTGFTQNLTCNNQPPTPIPCPPSGTPHVITGMLDCNGNCDGTNISWTVMNPLGTTVLSGSAAGPWFNLSIPSTAVTVNGLYMVKIQGICGGDTCECKLNLLFDGCGPNCTCDNLEMQVSQGVYLTSAGGCVKNIHSTATLTECDSVFWQISNSVGLVLTTGITLGDTPFQFTFPGSGNYKVCMRVKRTTPDGTMCFFQRCWMVQVSCGIPDLLCVATLLENPGFSEGAQPGVLGQGGASTAWSNNAGTPVVRTDKGCVDPVALKIKGNCIITDVVGHTPVPFAVGTAYSYRLCFNQTDAAVASPQPGGVLVGRLSLTAQGTGACVGECEEIFRIPLDGNAGGWMEVAGSFAPQLVTGNGFLSVHLENDFTEDDPATQSAVLVDNICIELPPADATENPLAGLGIRLFPNPTSNDFTLEFMGAVPKAGSVQILDLYGRLLERQNLPPGQQEHQLSLVNLPAGMYFVRVTDGGVPIWAKKLIKQ